MPCAQLNHRRCDGRLRRGPGAAAGGVQLPFGLGQGAAGTRQVFGQQADLLALQPRVHALDQTVPSTVLRYRVLGMSQLLAQFIPPLLEPLLRSRHCAVFGAKLRLYVEIHCVVHSSCSNDRVFCRERDFEHVR